MLCDDIVAGCVLYNIYYCFYDLLLVTVYIILFLTFYCLLSLPLVICTIGDSK